MSNTPCLPDAKKISVLLLLALATTATAETTSHPAAPPISKEASIASPLDAASQDLSALTLQDCFRLTALRSDSLKIDEQSVRAAYARMLQAVAGLFPTVNLVNTQNFYPVKHSTGSSSTGTFGSGSTSFNNNGYSSSTRLTLSQTIFNGFSNYNQVGAGHEAVEASRYNLQRSYQTLYENVASAFYQILTNQGDLVILGNLVQALQDRVNELNDRVNLGRSRPADLLQAQADLAAAKVTIEQTKGLLAAACELMAYYTGVPADQLKIRETQKLPGLDALESYLAATGARPDIQSLVASERQAERTLSATKGELWPTVSVNGNYYLTEDPPKSQGYDWSVSLQASLPLFDGGLILSRIREQKELVRQSRFQLEDMQRSADQSVRTAYSNFNSSVAQLVQLREETVISAENYNAQLQDYRRGAVSNLDVLQALQQYHQSRENLHSADMNARLNLIHLHVAAGNTARSLAETAAPQPAQK